jgi:hypothetical protein
VEIPLRWQSHRKCPAINSLRRRGNYYPALYTVDNVAAELISIIAKSITEYDFTISTQHWKSSLDIRE